MYHNVFEAARTLRVGHYPTRLAPQCALADLALPYHTRYTAQSACRYRLGPICLSRSRFAIICTRAVPACVGMLSLFPLATSVEMLMGGSPWQVRRHYHEADRAHDHDRDADDVSSPALAAAPRFSDEHN